MTYFNCIIRRKGGGGNKPHALKKLRRIAGTFLDFDAYMLHTSYIKGHSKKAKVKKKYAKAYNKNFKPKVIHVPKLELC